MNIIIYSSSLSSPIIDEIFYFFFFLSHMIVAGIHFDVRCSLPDDRSLFPTSLSSFPHLYPFLSLSLSQPNNVFCEDHFLTSLSSFFHFPFPLFFFVLCSLPRKFPPPLPTTPQPRRPPPSLLLPRLLPK